MPNKRYLETNSLKIYYYKKQWWETCLPDILDKEQEIQSISQAVHMI